MCSFPLIGGRLGRVFLVDFAGEPVPVEDRLGDHSRRDHVADAVQPADPSRREPRWVAGQVDVQGVLRRLWVTSTMPSQAADQDSPLRSRPVTDPVPIR
jgi:hypothetical protein